MDSINGGTAPMPPKSSRDEADLDFQVAIPVVYPQDTVDYQTVAIDNSDPGYQLYNTSDNNIPDDGGRRYPDLSAVDDYAFIVRDAGKDNINDGTSISTLLIAGIFNRIVNDRIKASRQHLLTSIGFSAVPGWDTVTGLGTPKNDELLKVFLALK